MCPSPNPCPPPQALDLLERNYGEKHWLFVSALHNLALCLEAAGRVGEARAAMERVLGLRLAMFGPRHFLYADSLYALGHMVRKEAIRQRGREGEQREGAGKGRGARGGRGRGGKAEDGAAEGLRMMAEAVRVLEEAGGWGSVGAWGEDSGDGSRWTGGGEGAMVRARGSGLCP